MNDVYEVDDGLFDWVTLVAMMFCDFVVAGFTSHPHRFAGHAFPEE